jgi:hypothetical protein
MSYSKGVIAIPNVTGNIVITVTTEATQLVNLFDSGAASYNYRISANDGGLRTGASGRVVTAPIGISSISTMTVQGVTEVANNDNYYTRIALYNGSSFVGTTYTAAPAYSFDIASLKSTYPTATHLRLELTLTYPNNCSASDTANLAIHGS